MKQKVDKRYSLHNSYFKNKKHNYPDTILEIVQYQNKYQELPFDYRDDDWLYQATIERQKRYGIQNSQYLTPENTARQIAELTNNFIPKDNLVLDACCGTGQLTKYLLLNKLNVAGFDNDPDMVEICKQVYPQAIFELFDFRSQESPSRFDLIVSNPPHEHKDMVSFFKWLSTSLTDEGRSILLIPKGFMTKERPKILVEYLARFEVLHREDMQESFAHTKWICEICIIGLSETYKNERRKKEETTSKVQIINENKTVKTNLMETEKVVLVALDKISANPDNSRKKFKQEELTELAHSIKEHGLLHAIILRVKGNGYEIVYGERRWRAYKINGETQIPAIIRDYTDEQILEITLVENVNRQDLSVVEESDAYQKLMDVHQYSIEDICHKLGKGEVYIRSRLRLQNLTGDFKELLEKGDISIGVGVETAKFSKRLQKQLYKEHFTGEDNNWKDLSLKEYTERVDKLYTNDLSKFNFNKDECGNCKFNTATYDLFKKEPGKCTNIECLLKKKNQFTVNFCKVVSDKFPEMAICIAPYDKMNNDIDKNLKEIGLDIKTMKVEEFPVTPVAPVESDYNSKEAYTAAMDEHHIEEMAFYKEIEEINEKIDTGKFKKIIYIGDNNPAFGYVKLVKADALNPVESLEKQDKNNKEAASKNAAKEVSILLQENEFPATALSVFEDELISFVMLDSLHKKYFSYFGFKDKEKQKLTEEDKYKIIKSITPEQKSLICRNFLQNNLTTQFGANIRSMFLIEFGKQHFEGKTKEIVRKHTETYNQKHTKIQTQIDALKKKEIPEPVS